MKSCLFLFASIAISSTAVTLGEEEVEADGLLRQYLQGALEYDGLDSNTKHAIDKKLDYWMKWATQGDRQEHLEGVLRINRQRRSLYSYLKHDRWKSEFLSPRIAEVLAEDLCNKPWRRHGAYTFLVHKKWATERTKNKVLWDACEQLIEISDQYEQQLLLEFISFLAPESPLVSALLESFVASPHWEVRMEVACSIGRLVPSFRKGHLRHLVVLACDPPLKIADKVEYYVSGAASSVLRSEQLSPELQLEYIRRAMGDVQNFYQALEILEAQKPLGSAVSVAILETAKKFGDEDIEERAQDVVQKDQP